jgi:hypothetical protein
MAGETLPGDYFRFLFAYKILVFLKKFVKGGKRIFSVFLCTHCAKPKVQSLKLSIERRVIASNFYS